MFRLLEDFSLQKNPALPLIYRALVYGIVSNPGDEIIREISWKNFRQIFTTQTDLPLQILLDPLLRLLNDRILRNTT